MNLFGSSQKQVSPSAELTRVKNLPRRQWTEAALAKLAQDLTSVLKTPEGTWTLRPLQALALHDFAIYGGLVGMLAVGDGKTLLSMLLPIMVGARVPLLLLPAALIEKTEKEREILAKHWKIAKHLRIYSYDMLSRVQAAGFLEIYKPDLLILDECFTGETLIRTPDGLRRIDEIKKGDLVWAFDGFDFSVVPVQDSWSKESDDIVEVQTRAGNTYTVTANHPFLTEAGWVAAGQLRMGDCLVSDLRKDFRSKALPEAEVLFKGLQEHESTDSRESQSCVGEACGSGRSKENARKQSHASGWGSSKSLCDLAKNWTQAPHPGWERTTHDPGAIGVACSSWRGMGTGSVQVHAHACNESESPLCDRPSAREWENRRRSGWEQSHCHSRTGTRCPEDLVSREFGVSRVSSVQRASLESHGGSVRVYNLHVDGPHTYVLGGGEVVHNCHRAKNKRAGVTKRLARYMHEHPDTKVAVLSGTLVKQSLHNGAHLIAWALKQGAPVPLKQGDVDEWADALDEGINPLRRLRPGPILTLSPPSEETEGEEKGSDAISLVGTEHRPVRSDQHFGSELEGAGSTEVPGPGGIRSLLDGGSEDCGNELRQARNAFRDRLTSTGGVVCSTAEGCTASLNVVGRRYPEDRITNEHFDTLRSKWETPDGWAFSTAVTAWRHARELAIGFHGIWDPRPPTEWLTARREWAAFVRGILGRSRTLDTELQVKLAVESGALADDGELARWKEYEPIFTVRPKDIWHDTSALDFCTDWMHRCNGIVWTEHVFFARELARRSGRDFYGAEGRTEDGRYLTDLSIGKDAGKVPIIASIKANLEGRNLQAWRENLITTGINSGDTMEQLIGRTHRNGQQADEVSVELLMGCWEHANAWRNANNQAVATRDTYGAKQKLLMATSVGFPDEAELLRMGSGNMRWSKQAVKKALGIWDDE